MPRFLTRWLKRLALLVVVLALLGLGAFTWLCYWPLEGGQERVEDLVPGNADFLLKTTWAELRDTGFLQKNLRDVPVVPALKEVWRKQVRPQLDRIPQIEGQINGQIPMGVTTFSVEQELAPNEIVIAGRLCRERGPPNPPSWREILVLFRTTWKVKAAVAALSHGFVRNQVNEQRGGVTIDPTEDEDILRLTFPNVPVSEARARSGCGDGFVMPPENLWYLTRVRDVIAISNSENLIGRTVDLARGTGLGEAFRDRPGFDLTAPSGSIAAAVDLGQMHLYLERLIETGGPRLHALKDFLDVDGLDRLNGRLTLASPDRVSGHASVRLTPAGLNASVLEAYRGPPLDLRNVLAGYVPAEDTYAFLQLRTDPEHLLLSIYRDALTDLERRLWDENNARYPLYNNVEAFLKDVAHFLGDSVGVAMARIGALYDRASFPRYESEDPEVPPSPQAGAVAFVIPLRKGAVQAEVDKFLAERVHLMGFSSELERIDYQGFTYSRMHFENLKDAADFRLVKPAFVLVQDRLVVASHYAYLERILDSYAQSAQHPSLAQDPTFQTAMAALPEQGHLCLWIDLEKLTRVPPRSSDPAVADPPGGPRGLLWDGRKRWVEQERDSSQRAREVFKDLTSRLGPSPTVEAVDQVDREVEAQRKAYESRYPEYLEEYRRSLLDLRRFRTFAFTVRGHGEQPVEMDAVAILREAEGLGP